MNVDATQILLVARTSREESRQRDDSCGAQSGHGATSRTRGDEGRGIMKYGTLLLAAARELAPLDLPLARDTYLDAISAAL